MKSASVRTVRVNRGPNHGAGPSFGGRDQFFPPRGTLPQTTKDNQPQGPSRGVTTVIVQSAAPRRRHSHRIVGPAPGRFRRGGPAVFKKCRPRHCPALCGTEVVKPEGEAMAHACPEIAPAPRRCGLELAGINWVQVGADIEASASSPSPCAALLGSWALCALSSPELPNLPPDEKNSWLELEGFGRYRHECDLNFDPRASKAKQIPFQAACLLSAPTHSRTWAGWYPPEKPRLGHFVARRRPALAECDARKRSWSASA